MGSSGRLAAHLPLATRLPSCDRAWIHDGSGPVAGTGHTIPVQVRSISVRFTEYSFGSVRVDGVTYDHDLIIDRGKIRKRNKAASKRFRGASGHTPLSIAEDIPWRLPPAGDRHRRRRRVAGDEASPGRGPPSQGRPYRPAHGTGDRRTDRDHKGHQRRPARDVLNRWASSKTDAQVPVLGVPDDLGIGKPWRAGSLSRPVRGW